MAGSAPFFTTTPEDPAAATPPTGKRSADASNSSQLQSGLEDLAMRRGETIPLGVSAFALEIRDVLMDHMLEAIETDLKYTVMLVCEDVPDFRQQPKQQEETQPEVQEVVATEQSEAATKTESEAHAVAGDPTVLFLEGLESGYQFLSRLSEGDSIPRCDATLLRIPVSKRDMEKEKHAAKKAIKKKLKKFKKGTGGTHWLTIDVSYYLLLWVAESAKPGAEFYVLSANELKMHLPSIPFDDAVAAAEFVSTLPLPEGETRSAQQLLLALDCEMCRTTKGVELTRLTLIDSGEQVLLDEYVRPKNPIVDYCTQYSGITCDIMEATTMRLAEIQQRFLELVPAEAILVGHSIENDLQALRVLHRRVIDTTTIYPHPKGPPFRSALRFLTSQYLHRAIQTGTDGHCSVEDAVATLQLAQLKIKRGPTFPSIEHEYKQKKVMNELARAKKSALIVDSQRACRSLSGGVACIIPREASDEVVQTVIHQLTTGFPPHLTWARIRGATRSEIVAHVQQINANLPEQSCLMTVLSGDTNDLRALHKRRTARTDPRSSLMWDKTQQDELDTVAAATQTGIVHILLK
ncbi:hypothetical protein BBJ28_00007752 [Nothophytophthora sp. Chile5]|nr:hypothetical protein BBJ28_00007752 [Nothophytophthora sp. Chile5]